MAHVDFRSALQRTAKNCLHREGNIILLEANLQEAIRSKQSLRSKTRTLNLENKEAVAHAVGVGAVKFYDLKTDRFGNGQGLRLGSHGGHLEGETWTLYV
ncbi:MAG: arginine--tRNA ligase [Streptococcus parasanguinis]